MADETTVDLDPRALAHLVDDEMGVAVLLVDRFGVRVRIGVSGDGWPEVSALAWRILRLEAEARAKTGGYRPEHNAVNGPGVNGPARR